MTEPEDVQALKDELWAAVLFKVAEIPNPRVSGDSRSNAYWSNPHPVIEVLCIYSVGQADGTNTVYQITAWKSLCGDIDVRVREYIDNHDEYWRQRIAEFDDHTAVIGDRHFRIGDEKTRRHPRGYGGRPFVIKFFDSRTVRTTNLWSQGTIPPKWRDALPSNAEFVGGAP